MTYDYSGPMSSGPVRTSRGNRFALSLKADRLLVPIEKSVVEPIVFSGKERGQWGPDLALIRLPELIARDIRNVKAFYNVDKRRPPTGGAPQYDQGLWAVLGAPAELSSFGEKEAVLKISLFASVISSVEERDGHDYINLSYFHEDRPELPRSYGGISGSGLWHLPISRATTGAIVWSGDARLEGVAFYQEPSGVVEGVIRCHGRRSLYERALSNVE